MVEKLASSEIAQSRERFEKFVTGRLFLEHYGSASGYRYQDEQTRFAFWIWQQAERDTRELCAQIVENEPLGYITESEHEKLENFADRVAERIRGKE